MSLIINARVYTGGSTPQWIKSGGVYYKDDTIVEVGTAEELQRKYSGQIIDAQGKLLMPGFICAHGHFYGMFARGMALKDDPPATFKEILERFINRCKEYPDPLLAATFGLHASFTVSDETLKHCVESLDATGVQKTGFHIHVAEGPEDARDSKRKYNKRTIIRLRDMGILRKGTLAVHCVDCDDAEIDAIAESGAFVIHNPESNMNNAVGVSDVLGMMDKTITVGLGTDGMTQDMWQESKVNYLLHKLNRKDPRVMGGETLKMLHENNSEIASYYFQKHVGVLAAGQYADMILVDYDPPTELSAGNFPWHMQFGMSGDMVDTTIVGGKVLMAGRVLKTLNEAEIMSQARARAPGVWDRF